MKKGTALVVILVLAAVIAGYFAVKQVTTPNPKPSPQTSTDQTITDSTPYTSKDLKISFNYPKGWSVEEEDRIILISNFKSSLHKNIELKNDQIEIMIDEFSGCFPTLEEDLTSPACGQGKVKNKIISEEVKKTSGGELLKYTIDSPDGNQRIKYFFQKGNMIFGIDKNPDPSQYEKEFEEIINSIQFL